MLKSKLGLSIHNIELNKKSKDGIECYKKTNAQVENSGFFVWSKIEVVEVKGCWKISNKAIHFFPLCYCIYQKWN